MGENDRFAWREDIRLIVIYFLPYLLIHPPDNLSGNTINFYQCLAINAVLFCSDHNFAMYSPLLDGPRPAAEAVGRDQGEHHKGGVHPRPGLCRLRHPTLLPRLRWFVYWRQNSISLMNARSRVILLLLT